MDSADNPEDAFAQSDAEGDTPPEGGDEPPSNIARDMSTDAEPPDTAGDSTETDLATADSDLDTVLPDSSDFDLSLCGDEPAELGASCSCGELGAAAWVCDDDEELVCTDGNDTPDDAEVVGLGQPRVEVFLDSWIDSAADIDWWRATVSDVDGPQIRPAVLRETEVDDDFEMELCVFYRYDGTRDITPYQCGFGSCAVYHDSAGTIVNGSCTSSPVFNLFTDLYGCCGLGAAVRVDGVDDTESPGAGVMYARIRTPTNELAEGCLEYSIIIAQ